MRDGNWKYVPTRGSGGFSSPQAVKEDGGQLYNLADDPKETRNLYQSNPAKVREMDALLQRTKAYSER